MTTSNGQPNYYDGEVLDCPLELQGCDDIQPKVYKIPIMRVTYYVHEPLARDVINIRNKRNAMIVYEGRGSIPKMGNVADLDLVLIHYCTYRADPSGKFKVKVVKVDGNELRFPDESMRVPLEVVRAWPAPIQIRLYKLINSMSNLDEEEDTVESLEMKIEQLQQALELKKKYGGSAKNEPSPTTASSEDAEPSEEASSLSSE